MWNAHEGMGWWMVFGTILTILFWLGIFVIIAWVVARVAGLADPDTVPAAKQKPLEIARERYAKGEITKDQFEQIKKDLA